MRPVTPKTVDSSHELYEKNIVMSGFRDKELENQIKSVGGKIGSSVNKKTFVLIVKDVDESSGKIEDAKKYDISILLKDAFIGKYF